MEHPTEWSGFLCTQTLWTSMMVSCQTSMRRILTPGTCRRPVWREAPLTPTMETCSLPTWLPKVTCDLFFYCVFTTVHFGFNTIWGRTFATHSWYKDKTRAFKSFSFECLTCFNLFFRWNLQNPCQGHHRDPSHSYSTNRIWGCLQANLVCNGFLYVCSLWMKNVK